MDDSRTTHEQATLAGRYELGSVLGQGGMGAVRDARDLRLLRPVAVKILRADLAADPAARRRFETEAKAAARLSHPNVVTVFDSGEDDGVPFLVMERLPGRTLADEIAEGPLPLGRVRAVAREILAALSAAHTAGIIHRDVKPGNVLLAADGHVKVSDFGIAKAVDDLDQTQTVELIATPGYLAPERLLGAAATERTDLYAVGVLLYEALSGRRPFAGNAPLTVMHAIERGHAPALTSPRSELPDAVVAVVERAMSVDPNARFASAAEMSAALEATGDFAEAEPIGIPWETETVPVERGWRVDATQTLPSTHTPTTAPAGMTAPPGTTMRARRRLISLGVVLLLAGLLVAGVVVNRAGSRHPVRAQPAVSGPTTPAPNSLPAALDDAIRRLEQAVAK